MYENIDKSIYTPMIQQYLTIKEDYQDTLVFFRIGDFYEMFFNDAIVASRELEIVLTGKDAGPGNDRVPMCGVPFHAVSQYLEKLTEKGYKVAIVEQLEDPALTKTLVKRGVIKIVTPGTNIDENYLNDKSNNYLGEIERDETHFYLSYVELSTGEAKVTDFPLQQELLYSEILKLGIKEVVVSPSFSKPMIQQLNKIYGVLISEEDNCDLDSYMEGLIQPLEARFVPGTKRLLSYIIQTQKRVLVHLQPFSMYSTKDYLQMNASAVKNLELIESIHGSKSKNNLFCVLDQCSTAMGSRYLKKSILYPFVKYDKINERLDFITELQKNFLICSDIRKELMDIYDLERIVGRISYGSLSPKDLIQLKKSLKVVPVIKENLLKMKGKIATKKANLIETYPELFELLEKAIDDNAGFLLREGNVIKEGYAKELDEIRNISSTNKDFIAGLEIREREKTGIKTLKVGFNKVFGYYIEITKSNLSQVKPEFGYIRKQTTSNSERYITQELKEREALVLRSDERSLELEIKLFNDIRNTCRTYSSRLQILAGRISELDMLIAFSKVSKERNYVRPTISLYDELTIKEGRHPVIEAMNDTPFVPNDLILYNNDKILLITGPNMAGKSTYMRQNALMVILAQMGCFVPAKEATLPIFDKIFTRIGSSDDISSGESTFMSEMLEVNTALTNATERSLIILDEVGRGTATFDGMALAQAIIEYLHDHVGAKTFFSTHYHELTSLDRSLPFLKNVHVEASVGDKENDIVFLHKVLPGPTDKSYGIHVASLAHLDPLITTRANDLLTKLESSEHYDDEKMSIKNYQAPVIVDKTDEIAMKLKNDLQAVDVDSLKPIDALLLLSKWKENLQ
jgi:DNA mismatch repair protein MutS